MKNILISKINNQLQITHFVENLETQQIIEYAEKMLPYGTPYRVGTTQELPKDRTFRDAWDIDVADYTEVSGRSSVKNLLDKVIEQLKYLQSIQSESSEDKNDPFKLDDINQQIEQTIFERDRLHAMLADLNTALSL